MINDFQRGRFDVLLLSQACGKEGITLTASNRMVVMDVNQLASQLSQVTARIHRISQVRACHVVRLATRHTIEHFFLESLLPEKQQSADKYVDAHVLDQHGLEYIPPPPPLLPNNNANNNTNTQNNTSSQKASTQISSKNTAAYAAAAASVGNSDASILAVEGLVKGLLRYWLGMAYLPPLQSAPYAAALPTRIDSDCSALSAEGGTTVKVSALRTTVSANG